MGAMGRRGVRRRSRHLPKERVKATKRNQKPPEWIDKGLIIAKDYIANKHRYSQDQLAVHIKAELGDRAPAHRRIVVVVSGWQRESLIPRSCAATVAL